MENNISRRSFAALGMAGAAVLAFGSAGIALADQAAAEGDAAEQTVSQVKIDLVDNAIQMDVTEVPAGPVTFTVTNVSAPAITEVELLLNLRILGEKENLAPGLDSVSFTKTLNGGDYKIYAPNAAEEYVDFKVTGEVVMPEGSTQDILAQGVQDYADYVTTQIQSQYDACVELQAAIYGGDLEEAKLAYIKARPYYERVESAVDGFLLPGATDVEDNGQSLDYLLDMRASSLDEEVGWHGFHAIERELWGNAQGIEEEKEIAEEEGAKVVEAAGDDEDAVVVESDVIEAGITDSTKELVDELVENARILNEEVIPTFADDLLPEDLANGAADLLEEVSTTKITGEEERYSKIDLLDFYGNVEGAMQAFACLRDGLLEIDEELVNQIDEEFQTMIDLLNDYRDPENPSGFVDYTEELRKSDGQKFADTLLPLHEDISSLAEKVALA